MDHVSGSLEVCCKRVNDGPLLPNRLEWKSDSPYLDSAAGLVNYKEGSGRGRLVQYGNSLRMTVAHPLFGVGPGNWPVALGLV